MSAGRSGSGGFGGGSRCPNLSPVGQRRCMFPVGHNGHCQAKNRFTWTATTTHVSEIAARILNARYQTEPVVSWRWWKVSSRGKLTSITTDHEWLTGTMQTAKLPDGTLMVPSKINHSVNRHYEDHGVYSYRTPSDMLKYSEWSNYINDDVTQRPLWMRTAIAVGKLQNYGLIVPHAHGYRSQVVKIQELWIFHLPGIVPSTGWIAQARARYNCTVHAISQAKIYSWARFFTELA